MGKNNFKKHLDNGDIFTIIDNDGLCSVCIENSKGKPIRLKKRLGYWDAIGFAYNRAKKKKRPKNYKVRECLYCGKVSRDVRPRNKCVLPYDSVNLCSQCNKKILFFNGTRYIFTQRTTVR